MIVLFIITLFATLIITRLISHNFHDRKNYGAKSEKSKTLTGYLRRKYGFNLHHIHFGAIIFIVSILIILYYGFTLPLIISLAIGTSLILDQITPLIENKSSYFSSKKLIISIILHILVSALIIIISHMIG